jgi:dipeptidyl aminopeptidase/acylaminoacyl peptidase
MSRVHSRVAVVAIVVISAVLIAGAEQSSRPAPAAGAAGRLTIDKLIDIKHPSGAQWSSDGKTITFSWDRAGVIGRYSVSADGSSAPVELAADAAAGQGGRGGRGGGRGGGGNAGAGGGNATSHDGKKIAAVVASSSGGSEIHVRGADGSGDITVTTVDGAASGLAWTPDDRRLTFTTGGGRGQQIFHDATPPYSGAKIIYRATENAQGTPAESWVVAADANATPARLTIGGRGGANRWLDATHLLVDRNLPNFKGRQIGSLDVTTNEFHVIQDDTKEKFWSITGDAQAGSQISPKGDWISFLSDKDGWDQLYVARAAGGAPIQLTKGKFETWRPAWSPDGTRIAFDQNTEADHGQRHIGVVQLSPGSAGLPDTLSSVRMLTSGRGADTSPIWSPDGTKILYQHTDPWNSADYYVIDANAPNAKPVRLTNSMPASIDKTQLVEPQLVHYKGPDGKDVPAYLFVPKNLDRTKKHPAIVWVHGDGVNQNYDGWHVQRNYAVYYSIHQYFLQQGYVVLAPDYRGSIGYGADWREGVYMDVGGKDFRDAGMANTYLKTLPYVNDKKIGIWGLSYGGFFTLLAVTEMPTAYAAAVDVAGVSDYALYYEDPYHGGWTVSRIGTPSEHPDVYAQASPVSHMDKLQTPLLILHGTADVNVPYIHSVKLLDEVMKNGKGDLVSFMAYPGEFHYFTREHVLRDAWHRVERFWDAHLKH